MPRAACARTVERTDSTPTAATRQSGFDWGDAGLGAAGMLSLLGLGTGVVVVGRRSRRVIS